MATTVTRPMPRAQGSPAPAAADGTESWQRAVLDALRAIRAALEQRPRPSHLTRGDRDRLAAILPAAGGVFGSELFLTRDLFASEAAALRLVLRGLNPMQVGRLFRRADGQAIDGYLMQRVGCELNTALWRIVRVHGFPEVSNLTVPPPAADARR